MENQVSSILILRHKSTSLKSAEQFLKNRGWELYFASNLKGLIINLAQKQPHYLLLPVDFPHRKVLALPNILSQAFPIKIIVYAENVNSISTTKLQEVRSAYRLYPPVSGPAIERMVFKIQRDEVVKAERQERERSGLGGGEGAGTEFEIRISQEGQAEARGRLADFLRDSGDGGAEDSDAADYGSGRVGESAALDSDSSYQGSNAPSEESGARGVAGSHEEADSGSFNNSHSLSQEGQDSQTKGYLGGPLENTSTDPEGPILDSIYRPLSEDSSGPTYITEEPPDEHSRKKLNPQANKTAGSGMGGAGITGEQVPFYGNQDIDFNLARKKAGNKAGNKAGRLGQEQNESGAYSEADVAAALKARAKASDSGLGAEQNENLDNFETTGLSGARSNQRYQLKQSGAPERDTIMVRGTQKALEESAFARSDSLVTESVKKVTKTSNAACIIIESPKFSGYLVAAMGADRQVDAHFINLIKDRLFKFLKANGESVHEGEESMEIKLEQVDFEAWAVEQAEFLRKAIHDDAEIAMAFFPSKEVIIQLEEGASDNMLQIDISELKEDVPVEFDLYIYLPENKKYLLYTPEGRPLFGNQKKRLMEKGVTRMHLRKEAASGVKKYRAQNFLNDQIAIFKANSPTDATPY